MLKSERLILKKPELEDVDKILKIQNSEFVQRYNMMKIYDKDDMIKEIVEEGKNTYYLQLIDAKEIIGAIFIGKDYFRHHVDSVCLSYYLDERYQRNGYMYESLKIVIDKLFEQGIEVISARVFEDNFASKKLLEKLGFELEGCLKKAVKDKHGIVLKSLILRKIVALLSFGWTPISPGASKNSSSIKHCTLQSWSFKIPSGVTAPGISFIIDIRSSFDAKDNERVWLLCLNSFKLTFLSPFTVKR